MIYTVVVCLCLYSLSMYPYSGVQHLMVNPCRKRDGVANNIDKRLNYDVRPITYERCMFVKWYFDKLHDTRDCTKAKPMELSVTIIYRYT